MSLGSRQITNWRNMKHQIKMKSHKAVITLDKHSEKTCMDKEPTTRQRRNYFVILVKETNIVWISWNLCIRSLKYVKKCFQYKCFFNKDVNTTHAPFKLSMCIKLS